MDKREKSFIIFSGGNYRALIAFCRELNRIGKKFHIVARTQRDLIFKTKYKKNVSAIRFKDYLDLSDLKFCLKTVKEKDFCDKFVICPSTEFLNQFLLKNKKFFNDLNCEIPLVEINLYNALTNKYSFTKICRENGLPVPIEYKSYDKIKYPCVAKPYHNVNKKDKSLYPYLLFNRNDFNYFIKQEILSEYFFQEYISGQSYYLLFHFYKNGNVQKFSQRNIIQQADGKSIVFAKTSSIHLKPIADKFINFLRHKKFFGLVMIELIKDKNKFYPIELNPRLWGPSQLFVDSGSIIFECFIRECLGEDKYLSENVEFIKKNHFYLWFNGIISDLMKKRKLKCYNKYKAKTIYNVFKNIRHDVYLRSDTMPLFYYELITFFLLRSQ